MDNNFSYNGFLTLTPFSSNPISAYDMSALPYEMFRIDLAQENGVFAFEFNYEDMPSKESHIIMDNTFEHIYCQYGCAYTATGDKTQQFQFENNIYKYLVASKAGAVFYGDLSIYQNDQYSDVWL